jgi:LacI family transcriptional regulator
LDDVRQWLGEAMESKHRPTAIFALNQVTSANVLQALHERKVQIPKEMALVGFDDFDLAAVVTPPLTTVAQFPVEIAHRAMGLLLKRIQCTKEETATLPAKIMLPVKLIVRASCGEHEKG